ncbi:hypothetical protein NE237_006339 [Protea cynaroides]|uniref:CP-type G domain-containing protein n=1 Tax=Protea cynaroides TaxID=273540 RepID=A0A9Q0QV30_9MAGN|nr:hypothetical protein NE237_006339 [Protea cynaroides]
MMLRRPVLFLLLVTVFAPIVLYIDRLASFTSLSCCWWRLKEIESTSSATYFYAIGDTGKPEPPKIRIPPTKAQKKTELRYLNHHLENKSKRVPLKKKYKIIKKVKQHHKKKAKEAKKLGFQNKRKDEKDPGIPNDWPFKEQELKALEARRAQALEEIEQKKAARKERAQKRKLGLLEDDGIAQLANGASEREQNLGERVDGVDLLGIAKSRDNLDRTFYKELVKVIEASDVILEVLDARDPQGTRCIDMEKMVLKSGPNKRLVLLLNKIDLVPREGWKSASKAAKPSNLLETSDCLGADTLIKLLKNYSRSHEIKKSITVGIIGLPNVGKSSLINSLKRCHVVNVGATPGLTRSMQEVHLDKNVKLLDCKKFT